MAKRVQNEAISNQAPLVAKVIFSFFCFVIFYFKIKEVEAEKSTLISVYKKIWLHAWSVLLVFFITFLVFPGVIIADGTKLCFCSDVTWSVVLMITFFNIFDTCGRFSPNLFKIFSKKTLWVAVLGRLDRIIRNLIRTIFVMFYLFIAYRVGEVFFCSTAWKMINIILFAFTNGYCSTLAMIYGPMVVNDNEREKSGQIMSFHLVFGIFLGSLVAEFGMGPLMESRNPLLAISNCD